MGFPVALTLSPSQICAVLAAVTEVIRGQGGKETETEYFAALVSAGSLLPTVFNTKQPVCWNVMLSISVYFQMTTLEVVDSAESQAAVAYLLNLVMKRLVWTLYLHHVLPTWLICYDRRRFSSGWCAVFPRVPAPVLKSKFSDTTKALMDVMSKEASSEGASALRWVSSNVSEPLSFDCSLLSRPTLSFLLL